MLIIGRGGVWQHVRSSEQQWASKEEPELWNQVWFQYTELELVVGTSPSDTYIKPAHESVHCTHCHLVRVRLRLMFRSEHWLVPAVDHV